MKFERKLKNDLDKSFEVKDQFDEICSHIEFHSQPTKKENYFMKKRVLVFTCASAVLVAGVATSIYFAFSGGENKLPSSLVTVDVNPSIQFALDENNRVLSVTGENDEGKMIIAGENLVGKDIEDALNVVFKIENETGYLIGSELVADGNKITFTISCDSENIEKTLRDSLTSVVDTIKEELHFDELSAQIEEYTREKIEEFALLCDPSLSEEDVKKMSDEQLLSVISLYHLETAELYSQELEDLYLYARDYEVKFAEEEFTKNVIAESGKIYQTLLDGYDTFLNKMTEGIDKLNEIRYEYLISEDSDYQKALKDVMAKKEEVLNLRATIAKAESQGLDTQIYLGYLEVKEAALDLAIEAMNAAKDIAISAIDAQISIIKTAYDAFKTLRDSLISSEELEKMLDDNAKKLDSTINEVKDSFFDTFEKAHKDDIERIKKEVLDYKEHLKEIIAAGYAE